MKVFSINGYTKSGKTTTVENVIKELKVRGFSVGSVKEIHYEEFEIDVEGTNTSRHRSAGSELVTARGMYETDILFQEKISMEKLLSFYKHDYVVLEGVNDINAPKIITGHNTKEIDEKIDYRTMAVSGVIAEQISEYKGFQVINCIKDTKRLVDYIEEKVPELLPDFDAECCGACGLNCHEMLTDILSGKKKRSDCTISKSSVNLLINGKPVDMVPFVQNILRNTVLGVVSQLKGFSENSNIEISIGSNE